MKFLKDAAMSSQNSRNRGMNLSLSSSGISNAEILRMKKEIDFRLDLINVFNEFLQRKTAKLLFTIIDSHVFNTAPKGQYIEVRKDLISKDFQEFENIQGYRTKEVDAYFNKILENEDVLMHVNGNEEIVNLLNEKGVGGAFLNVFDPNGEHHIEIRL
jgi:hypothetical protein